MSYRLVAILKLFENPFLGKEEYFSGAFPGLCNIVAQLTTKDQENLVDSWSQKNVQELTSIVRNIQSLVKNF